MLMRLFGLWTRLRLRLQGVRAEERQIDEFRLRYYRSPGPGDRAERWLLLHGLGSTALTWGSTISALRPECRMWIPELSSLGGTVGPVPGMNVAEATETMAELIAAVSPGRPVTVCGISLGGWVAVRLALEHPELVDRLVLVNSAGFRDQDWERVAGLVRLRTLDDVDRLYRALFLDTPWLLALSKPAFLQAYTSPAVRYIIDSLSEEDAFDEADLARIRCPTALVWGRHDGLFPIETGRRMAAAIPEARLTELEAAHAVHWEFPATMNRAIATFRRQTATSSSNVRP